MITAGAADPAGQAAFGQCPELTAVELSDLAQKTRLSGQSSDWEFGISSNACHVNEIHYCISAQTHNC